MAFLWKHPKSNFWQAGFSDEGGRRRNRSTRETDRRKAQAIADGWEHAARLAREGTLTADKARSVVSEILERVSQGRESLRAMPTDAFLERWLEHKAGLKSEGTAARYASTVRQFLLYLDQRRKCPLASLRTADIQGFVSRRNRERSGKTVSVDIHTLAAAFNAARRQGLIDRNPCEGVELATVESVERQPFTPAEVRLLVDTAQGEWRTAILIAYFTGARLRDVANLTWQDVSFTQGTLTYRQMKTGTKVEAPLHPDLERHLSSLAGDSGGFIMPSLGERGTGGARGLSAAFAKIMRQAGIGTGTVEGKGGRQQSTRSFHSLRHSFESHLAAANVSAETRRELAGRADEATQRVYTHNDREHLRVELAKLPSIYSMHIDTDAKRRAVDRMQDVLKEKD